MVVVDKGAAAVSRDRHVSAARPTPMVQDKRKILVVEDEKDIRELLRYNLEQEGFAVLEAEDAIDLGCLRRQHHDR